MVDKGKGIAEDSGKRKRNGDDKSGNRKRKNLNVLQFFEDSAFEVEESGSSDEDDFIDDVFLQDDFGPDIEVKAEPKTPNIPFFPKQEELDEEELEKVLEERYKPGSTYVRYAEDRTEASRSDERDTHMTYVNDPTIWKVKCVVGRERHSAFCLMQKFVDLKALGTKLQIVSAFAVDHVKGFIYIEAEKQFDINEACKGLCNIYPSRVSPVPPSDVPHLFSIRRKYSEVKVDTWARVKAGKYKGDLAQVVNVNMNGAQKKVTVKLVPRIDLQAVAEKFGGGVSGKKSTIPAPRLITSSELEAYRPLVTERRDRDTGDMYEVFDGMTLKDGYLYKKVPLDSLSFFDVRPSEAELIKFMPANKEESNDVEWLTGLFGERKKKKQSVNNDKTGEKGEGSSSMENSFEVPDLVFHGRKAFGIVIGREKDDRIKVLEEGTEKPMVVAVEARLLKKADFEKNLNALDHLKKIIYVNDIVRVLEGPLEDKRGIVRQIYKGVVFVHDENEQENCGYFCAKAKICEKMGSSVSLGKGKGGKAGGSGFEDFPTSPKSPLSPNKPFEGTENKRNFDQEERDGFSVGQSLRIKVGPLKGYMCRVMAIRYSDITVKLDSQHKILTVKAEHLAEVKGKTAAVSTGDGQESAKPFDLLGEAGSSQGWMEGGVATESGGGGWNTGGQTTERSGWAPFPAAGSSQPESGSANPDANKDEGGSGWNVKKSEEESRGEKKESGGGGWGSGTKAGAETCSSGGGWGNAGGGSSNDGEKKSAWGATATETGGWGSTAGGSGEVKSAWGAAAAAPATESGGWKAAETSSDGGGWGNAAGGSEKKSAWGASAAAPATETETGGWSGGGGEVKSAWGAAAPASESGAWAGVEKKSGWGTAAAVGESGGWGSNGSGGEVKSAWGGSSAAAPVAESGGGSSGGAGKSAWGGSSGAAPVAESGGWGGGSSSGGAGKSAWGAPAAASESGGWGAGATKKDESSGGGGWGKAAAAGGSSWGGNKDEEEGKKDESGGGWGKSGGGGWGGSKTEGGSSSWSKQDGGGGGGSQGGGRGSGGCFKCGESGHMSRECPKGGNACFKCGETGHMSRECPQGGGGPKSCFKCGETGHMSRECPQGGGGGSRSCYKCGETGHMSRECPQGGGGRSCYKCGESGHMSRECPQGGGGGGGGGGGRNCYKCGESGHISRECPQGGAGGGGGGGGWGSGGTQSGGWSSGQGGWGSKQASDAAGEKKDDGQGGGGGGWGSSGGGWGGSGGGDQTGGSQSGGGGGWGSNNNKDDAAQGSGWNKPAGGGW